MPHFIELDLCDLQRYGRLGELYGSVTHPAIDRGPGDLEHARNDAVAGASHAVEKQGERVFGSGLAPRRGAGKLVATGAPAALLALDRLDMTIFADMGMRTLGTGWPYV